MKKLAAVLVLFAVVKICLQAEPPKLTAPAMKSPEEELKTFQVHPGFTIELVASEPLLADPVALTFDHDGRLYVCEMRGYPNDGNGTGTITSGSIKLLTDRDGDGKFETATTFADGLRFPMSVQPWKKGVLVAVAPDILYLEDTDGDGRADVRRVVYTGFGVDNIQQLLNSLQWGMDNWIYGCNGASGGTITCPDLSDGKPVSLGNRGIRFKPDEPGSLEPMSGGGQYGLTPSPNQEWFTSTNSQHLRQIVLPDHYLRRNPGQASPVPTIDIPEHGPACKVFRISPFESWRVERTTRRSSSADAGKFPKTELVPGGFSTSSCSPVYYAADRFSEAYRGGVFICEPANNLIFRDGLVDDGAVYKSKRLDDEREFFASTDNCFRPVHQTIGPDGALYVADFYRPIIETPRSLPDDIKAQIPLQSQDKGRIWRVRPDDQVKRRTPAMSKLASAQLVPLLDDPNIWWRLNAQRLLVERKDMGAIAALREMAKSATHDFGKAHALWTLDGLGAIDEADIVTALGSESLLLKCQALRLAEGAMTRSDAVRRSAVALADDDSIRVRMQAALSLGATGHVQTITALARIAKRDGRDRWVSAAILSSTQRTGPALLHALMLNKSPGGDALVPRLMAQVGVNGTDEDLARLLALIAAEPRERQTDAIRTLGQALQYSRRPLPQLWKDPPVAIKQVAARFTDLFLAASTSAAKSAMPLRGRVADVELLAFGPFATAEALLPSLIDPQQPHELQLAAVRSLAAHIEPAVAPALLKTWPAAGPAVRREIQEALFARADRLPALLDAVEAKSVLPQQLDSARIAQLRSMKDAKLRVRAETLLAGAIDSDRQKVIERYKDALDLKADRAKGKLVFRKVCATCHRLDDFGTEVGPDLRTALRDKTSDQLLVSILDPSREVDRRFTNYLVETKSGRSLSGMIATETATSILLRRAEKAEDTVLRAQIDSLRDTAKSLMPDALEQQLTKQDLADVIAYLRSAR